MMADAEQNNQNTEEEEAPVSSFHRSHIPRVPDGRSTSEVKAEKDPVPPQAIAELPQRGGGVCTQAVGLGEETRRPRSTSKLQPRIGR